METRSNHVLVGSVVLALLLAAFWLLLLFMGRPIAPRMIEVDVTDKIAESAPR